MKICNLCGTVIKNREFVDGKLRNFQRRKYCLDCSPFGSGNTRKIEKLFIPKKKKKKNSTKKCLKWQKKARKERKEKLINIFGGSCPFCKYFKCYKSFNFHHVDPSEKDSAVSAFGMLTKWEKIVKQKLYTQTEVCYSISNLIILCVASTPPHQYYGKHLFCLRERPSN